jgi:hypothetical protein
MQFAKKAVKRHQFRGGDPEICALLYKVYGATGNPRAASNALRFGMHRFQDQTDLQRLSLLP